jgi:hypothetical protein
LRSHCDFKKCSARWKVFAWYPIELTKSAKPSRTEASSSTIEIIDALGIWFLYVQSTLEPEKLLALLRTGEF